jgi:hypothetical protein
LKLGERIELLRKTVSGITLTLLLMALLTSVFNIQTSKSESPSVGAWASIIPSIDGTVSTGEWDDASTLTFDFTLYEYHKATLYVKNDFSTLFMALIITNDDYHAKDEVLIGFDDNNDNNIQNGEDALRLCGNNEWSWDGFAIWEGDRLYWISDVGKDGGTYDLVSAVTHTNPSGIGDYTFRVFSSFRFDG